MFIRSNELDSYISKAKIVLELLESNEKLPLIEKTYSLIKDIHSVSYNKVCVEFSVRIVVNRVNSLKELLHLYNNDKLQYAVFDTMSLVEIPLTSLACVNEELVIAEINKAYNEILESKYKKRVLSFFACDKKEEKRVSDFNFDDYTYEQMSLQF